jgi:hypothetical protein
VILRTAESLDALAVRSSLPVDVLRSRSRANKADGSDAGMFEDQVDRFLIALNDTEDSVGKPGLF